MLPWDSGQVCTSGDDSTWITVKRKKCGSTQGEQPVAGIMLGLEIPSLMREGQELSWPGVTWALSSHSAFFLTRSLSLVFKATQDP